MGEGFGAEGPTSAAAATGKGPKNTPLKAQNPRKGWLKGSLSAWKVQNPRKGWLKGLVSAWRAQSLCKGWLKWSLGGWNSQL